MSKRFDDHTHPLYLTYIGILENLNNSEIDLQVAKGIADRAAESMKSDKSDSEVEETLTQLGCEAVFESQLLRKPPKE